MKIPFEMIGLAIAVLSAFAAITSAILAHHSAKTAQKSYSSGLLSQSYDMYHTEAMYHALQLVWQTYHKIWQENCADPEDARQKTNRGEFIPNEIVHAFVAESIDQKEDAPEWAAIHKVWTFWTYVVVLINKDVLDEQFVTAFTSPRILGFLAPCEEEFLKIRRGETQSSKSPLRTFYSTYKKS